MHHSLLIYEEDVRVPLIVRWPTRLRGGRSIEEPVQLADISPTVLEFAGARAHEGGVGKSLAAALVDEAPLDPKRPIFLQRREYSEPIVSGHAVVGEKLGVRRGRWKYIEARDEGTAELYDLETDPDERRNLAERRPHPRAALAKVLRRWQAATARPALPRVDPEAEERLRALGYVP
jgi:arylsulfatase A-like enzyme